MHPIKLSDRARRWNRFTDLACEEWIGVELNETQYNAQQCALYAIKVSNDGHEAYLETFRNDPERMSAALKAVGGAHFADNYLRAVRGGTANSLAAADAAFNAFSPTLAECLEAYVEAHQDEIFAGWEDA